MDKFTIDHFLPWSFVAHNDVWNTVPIPQTVNSAKGNRLPAIDRHLPLFLDLQWRLFEFAFANEPLRHKERITFQAYTNFFKMDDTHIYHAGQEAFVNQMREQVEPLICIARSQGFGIMG